MANWAKRTALAIGLKKVAGATIPRSGEAAKDVDCFSIQLRDDANSPEYLVQKRVEGGYDALKWTGDAFDEKAVVPSDSLGALKFSAQRYYGPYTLYYDEPYQLIISELTFKPRLVQFRDSFEQQVFNSLVPTTLNRKQILTRLVEDDIAKKTSELSNFSSDSGASHIEIADRLYGRRLFGHPDCDHYLAITQLHLDALVESGELSESQGGYRLNPNALSTLAMLEQDERRHSDQLWHNRILAALTLILALAGVIQACVILLQWLDLALPWGNL